MTTTEPKSGPRNPSMAEILGATPANKHTSVIDIVRHRGSLWNADELAGVLDLSRKHIYKLSKSGRIPCIRMGGAIRFDPEATAQWLENRAA
jgi:excisionase family DNA binding protein